MGDVLAFVSSPASAALSKPDVAIQAELLGSESTERVRKPEQPDSFTPQFTPPLVWTHVPIDHSVRLSVEVFDEDAWPLPDDPIGVFQIRSEDMDLAKDAGNVYQVRVDQQTNSQVLLAAISVMQE